MPQSRLELQVESIASHECLRVVSAVSALAQRSYGFGAPRGNLVEFTADVPILGPPARRYLRMREAGAELGRRVIAQIGKGRVRAGAPPRAAENGDVVTLTWTCVAQ